MPLWCSVGRFSKATFVTSPILAALTLISRGFVTLPALCLPVCAPRSEFHLGLEFPFASDVPAVNLTFALVSAPRVNVALAENTNKRGWAKSHFQLSHRLRVGMQSPISHRTLAYSFQSLARSQPIPKSLPSPPPLDWVRKLHRCNAYSQMPRLRGSIV